MGKKLSSEKAVDRVWLAGLGALAVAEQEGNDLFQRLVEKGKELQETSKVAGSRFKHPSPAASSTGKVKLDASNIILLRQSSASKQGHRQTKSKSKDPATVAARQARRLERARRAFLREFGALETSSRDCERWKQEGRIFTVSYDDATFVPSFQFDEKGRPRPAIARVIQILGKDSSDWGLALWFFAVNGWLDGKRPVDLLKDEPEEVIQAAEQEAAELVF